MMAIPAAQARQPQGASAGPLLPRSVFSYYEIYDRVEGLEASRQRLFGTAGKLVKATQHALANSVMGSSDAAGADALREKFAWQLRLAGLEDQPW